MDSRNDEEWPGAWRGQIGPLWMREAWSAMLEGVEPSEFEGQTVLVAECRAGTGVAALREAWPGAARVMAVDADRAMVDEARSQVAGGGPPTFFKVEGVQSLSFADDVFRAAVCLSNLHEAAGILNALSCLRRVVADGGCILFGASGSASFPLLMDLLSEHCWGAEDRDVAEAVDRYRDLPLAERALREAADRLELDLMATGSVEFDVELGTGGKAMSHPAVREFIEPRLLQVFDQDVDRTAARQALRRALDRYFDNALVVDRISLVWGRLKVAESATFRVDEDDVIEELVPGAE